MSGSLGSRIRRSVLDVRVATGGEKRVPKVTGRRFWKAKVAFEIDRLALAVHYTEKGTGSERKRHLIPTDWLDQDGNTIIWDVGKRLKGWLKQQIATMKSSWRNRIQYGVVCKSLPEPGYNAIGELSDILPSINWHSFSERSNYEVNELPEPNVEQITTEKKRSLFTLHYVLGKQIHVSAEIYCYAYGVHPESMEDWLRTLGIVHGLGDMHNSSAAYGTFSVKKFEITEDKEIRF